MNFELNVEFKVEPAMSEAKTLVAALEQALENFPGLRPQVLDLLFTGSDNSLKPGLVDLVSVPAMAANDPSVIELRITNRFRELVAAAAAGELQLLGID